MLSAEERQHYTGMSVTELEREIRRLNENRMFTKSKEVANILKSRKSKISRTNSETLIKETLKKVDNIFIEYNFTLEELELYFKSREMNLRETIDLSFTELKERQQNILIELTVNKELEALKAKDRVPCEVRKMRALAVRLANLGKFDEASELDKSADAKLESERQLFVANTIQKHDSLIKKTMKRFENEIAVLDEKLRNGMAELQRQLDREIHILQTNASISVRKIVKLSINGAAKTNTPVQSSLLTKSVTDRIAKYGMNENFQFS